MDIATVFSPFPHLDTERLLLRALRPADLDDLYAYAADPELARHTEWDHYASRDEAAADLDGYLRRYDRTEQPLPVWGIEHRADRRLIGICNISRWWIEDRRAEIGYAVSRRYWGHGMAVEAARAMIDFGFSRMGLMRIQATCLPINQPSQRVMLKLGLRHEGRLRAYETWAGAAQDLEMYAITRGDWEAEKG
ncbi:MAG TPA: GNAT family protein [Herpetosiphonaceae bacterium]|nr:GNAT family protein [Herpetosiphonaceae bacterium]